MPALVVSLVDSWVGELIRCIDIKHGAGSFIVDADLILGWQFAIHNERWIDKAIPDDVWKCSLFAENGILKLGQIVCVGVVTSALITVVMN